MLATALAERLRTSVYSLYWKIADAGHDCSAFLNQKSLFDKKIMNLKNIYFQILYGLWWFYYYSELCSFPPSLVAVYIYTSSWPTSGLLSGTRKKIAVFNLLSLISFHYKPLIRIFPQKMVLLIWFNCVAEISTILQRVGHSCHVTATS